MLKMYRNTSSSKSSPDSPFSHLVSFFSVPRPTIVKAVAALISLWVVIRISRASVIPDGEHATARFGGVKAPNSQVDTSVSIPGANPNNGDSADDSLQKGTELSRLIMAQQHTDRAAVIMETRPLPNLIPVILHFNSVLGPEWPIIFYTTPSTAANLSTSAPFFRAVNEGRVAIRYLPPTAVLTSHRAISLFLTKPWIWEDLAPYSKVLFFQDDSIICSTSPQKVDDFIKYDLVGAPIAPRFGQGFNGGLSLRNRELVLDLVTRYSWANDSTTAGAPQHMLFEDQWMYTRMKQLPARADGSPGANLPSMRVAGTFAVETVWSEAPLGYHQPFRWQAENMGRIMKYCPEVGMIASSAFF